jgi:hypothetical protein
MAILHNGWGMVAIILTSLNPGAKIDVRGSQWKM